MVKLGPMGRGRRPERYKVMLRFFSYVGEVIEIDKLRKFIYKNVKRKIGEEYQWNV